MLMKVSIYAYYVLIYLFDVKAGFHLCEYGRKIARPVVWACVVCFNGEDSPIIGDLATDFGSWIDFNFFCDQQEESQSNCLDSAVTT